MTYIIAFILIGKIFVKSNNLKSVKVTMTKTHSTHLLNELNVLLHE